MSYKENYEKKTRDHVQFKIILYFKTRIAAITYHAYMHISYIMLFYTKSSKFFALHINVGIPIKFIFFSSYCTFLINQKH